MSNLLIQLKTRMKEAGYPQFYINMSGQLVKFDDSHKGWGLVVIEDIREKESKKPLFKTILESLGVAWGSSGNFHQQIHYHYKEDFPEGNYDLTGDIF